MMSLKSVRICRQQLHVRDVRGLVAFYFCPLEEKIVKSCFQSIFEDAISRPDKHAKLLKIYFKTGRKIIHHEPVHVG